MTQRQTVMLLLTGGAMFILFLVIIFGDNGLVEYNRMRVARNSLMETNERITQENDKLYRTIDRLQNDPLFIESTARRELGMIRSDELIFKFPGKQCEPNAKTADQR